MTGDLDILFSDDLHRSIEENISRNPMAIALDRGIPNAALVASQVKYLARSERKLPSYYAARCIIPPLAFEQSSSEETAARKNYMGRVCIDLTCGLGVDSFFLSKKFDRVISVERDPELADIARENFRRLGAQNIEVVNTTAEEFLAGLEGKIDLVYADPDRRNSDGKKLVRIEDCSPDIVSLIPQIKQISPRLVVKLSPMFDVDEAFRVFGEHTRVEVVSLGGECKEVIAEISDDIPVPAVCAIAIGLGEVCYPFEEWNTPAPSFEPGKYRWLMIPDVSLQKARIARRYCSERIDYIDSDNGYGFAAGKPENIIGRMFEIESLEPFDPKCLKRRLKTEGIKSLDIMKRNFPLSSADVARQLGVREGGSKKIAFTKANGKLWQVIMI